MDEYIAVYIYDVKNAINELDGFFDGFPRRFDAFEKDVERIISEYGISPDSIK